MRLFASAVLLAASLIAPPAMAQSGWGMSEPVSGHVGELSPLGTTHRYWISCLGEDAEAAVHGCGRVIGARVSRVHTASAHYFRSVALGELGEAERARRDLLRAYVAFSDAAYADPEDARAIHGRGLALIRLGDRAAGEADLARARALSEGRAGEFFDING